MSFLEYKKYKYEITVNFMGSLLGYVYLKNYVKEPHYYEDNISNFLTYVSKTKIGFDCCRESYRYPYPLMFALELPSDSQYLNWNITDIKNDSHKDCSLLLFP